MPRRRSGSGAGQARAISRDDIELEIAKLEISSNSKVYGGREFRVPQLSSQSDDHRRQNPAVRSITQNIATAPMA
jgi:hypothetical protein